MKEEKAVGSKARRITTKMREEWTLELEKMGHLNCPMIGCLKRFVTVANFQTHYRWCTGKKNLQKCSYCDSSIFSDAKSMLKHMETFHEERVEEYKEKLANAILEEGSSTFVAFECESTSIHHVEEVSQAPFKSSRKKYVSSKENNISDSHIIWKHKMKSLNESDTENINQFRKCVRYDKIADTIKSVGDAVNSIEELQDATEIKVNRRKATRKVVPESVIEKQLYFEDADSFLNNETCSENDLKNERLGTKSLFVLDREYYKRYHENLTMTRDWSSERKTYTRSRNSDPMCDISKIGQNASSQDVPTMNNSSMSYELQPHSDCNIETSCTESMHADNIPDEHQLNENVEPKEFILKIEPQNIPCDIALKTSSKDLNIDLLIGPEICHVVNQHLYQDEQSDSAPVSKNNFKPVLSREDNIFLKTPSRRKSTPLLPIITYGKQSPEEIRAFSKDPVVEFNTLLNSPENKEANKSSQNTSNYVQNESRINESFCEFSTKQIKHDKRKNAGNFENSAKSSPMIHRKKKYFNKKYVKSKLNVLTLFSCKAWNRRKCNNTSRNLIKMKNVKRGINSKNTRVRMFESNDRKKLSSKIKKPRTDKSRFCKKLYLQNKKQDNVSYSTKESLYEDVLTHKNSRFKCFSEVSDFLYEHSAASYNKAITNVILDGETSLTEYQDIEDVCNMENFKYVNDSNAEQVSQNISSATTEYGQELTSNSNYLYDGPSKENNIPNEVNVSKEITEDVKLPSDANSKYSVIPITKSICIQENNDKELNISNRLDVSKEILEDAKLVSDSNAKYNNSECYNYEKIHDVQSSKMLNSSSCNTTSLNKSFVESELATSEEIAVQKSIHIESTIDDKLHENNLNNKITPLVSVVSNNKNENLAIECDNKRGEIINLEKSDSHQIGNNKSGNELVSSDDIHGIIAKSSSDHSFESGNNNLNADCVANNIDLYASAQLQNSVEKIKSHGKEINSTSVDVHVSITDQMISKSSSKGSEIENIEESRKERKEIIKINKCQTQPIAPNSEILCSSLNSSKNISEPKCFDEHELSTTSPVGKSLEFSIPYIEASNSIENNFVPEKSFTNVSNPEITTSRKDKLGKFPERSKKQFNYVSECPEKNQQTHNNDFHLASVFKEDIESSIVDKITCSFEASQVESTKQKPEVCLAQNFPSSEKEITCDVLGFTKKTDCLLQKSVKLNDISCHMVSKSLNTSISDEKRKFENSPNELNIIENITTPSVQETSLEESQIINRNQNQVIQNLLQPLTATTASSQEIKISPANSIKKRRGRPRKSSVKEPTLNATEIGRVESLACETEPNLEFGNSVQSNSVLTRKSNRIRSRISSSKELKASESDEINDENKNAIGNVELINASGSDILHRSLCIPIEANSPIKEIPADSACSKINENTVNLSKSFNVETDIAADYEVTTVYEKDISPSRKKPRGRPRKLPMQLYVSENDNFKTQTCNSDNTDIAKTSCISEVDLTKNVKKRGRPKKILNEQLIADCASPILQNKIDSSNLEKIDHVISEEIPKTNKLMTDNIQNLDLNCSVNSSECQKFESSEFNLSSGYIRNDTSVLPQKRGRPRKYPLKGSQFIHNTDFLNHEKGKINGMDESFVALKKHKKRGRPRKCFVQSDFVKPENNCEQSSYTDQNILPSYSEMIRTGKHLITSFRKSPRKGQPKKCARYADINSEVAYINQINIDSSDEEIIPKKRRKIIPNKNYSQNSDYDQELSDEDVREVPDISISFASNSPSDKSTLSLKEGRILDTKNFKRSKRFAEKLKQNLHGEKIIKMGVDCSLNTSLLDISSDLESPINKLNEISPVSNLIQQKKIPNFQNFKPKRCSWKTLSESEQVQYYPPMVKAMLLRNELTETDVELNCFESTNLDVESRHIAIFTGAPIWSSAWCPTPIDKKAIQYIAISTSGNLSEYHSYVSANKDKSLIQLWNLGYLQGFKLEEEPSVQLCISFNHGNIFDMVWCPSGCWEDPSENTSSDELSRLGLLAVASSDTFIRIYSFPHPGFVDEDHSSFPLYDACPSVILRPSYNNTGSCIEKTACMTISWDKTDYCERIAGGYGNGLICVWLLSTTSSLLIIDDEVRTVIPYLIFHSHGTPVTDLAFAPYAGNRWLISTGFEKEMKFWDLTNTSMPVAAIKDGYASNVEWAAQCCGAIINYHESISFRAPQFFREIEMESSTAISMDDCNTTAKKSAYSELMNAIAVTDATGEITAKFVHTVHTLYRDSKTKFPHRRTHAGKSVIPPLKQVNEDILNPFADCPLSVVNTISWNPNNQSRFWLLAGGHSGIARLSCLSDLKLENNS